MKKIIEIDLNGYIKRFAANAVAIESLVADVSAEQAGWRPAPEKWSILEVVNHLFDEEREDFRSRLEKVLRDPTEPFLPISPAEWVLDRKYNERNPAESLNNFLLEREKSINWLKSVSDPNWKNTHQRPPQEISAGDLLAAWLAHDLLHIKQLARLHYDYLNLTAAPFKTEYAGNWV